MGKHKASAMSSRKTKKAASDAAKPKGGIKVPKLETEYHPEKRNLEDLWQATFPVGTEWDNMDKLRKINWCFSNLESAFEEGSFTGKQSTCLNDLRDITQSTISIHNAFLQSIFAKTMIVAKEIDEKCSKWAECVQDHISDE